MKNNMNLFTKFSLAEVPYINPEENELKKNYNHELFHLVHRTSYFVPEISGETGDFNAI